MCPDESTIAVSTHTARCLPSAAALRHACAQRSSAPYLNARSARAQRRSTRAVTSLATGRVAGSLTGGVRQVDLSRNGLGPHLPDLSPCRALVSLRLARNRLAGPPPLAALAAAVGLRELDLSDNALEG